MPSFPASWASRIPTPSEPGQTTLMAMWALHLNAAGDKPRDGALELESTAAETSRPGSPMASVFTPNGFIGESAQDRWGGAAPMSPFPPYQLSPPETPLQQMFSGNMKQAVQSIDAGEAAKTMEAAVGKELSETNMNLFQELMQSAATRRMAESETKKESDMSPEDSK